MLKGWYIPLHGYWYEMQGAQLWSPFTSLFTRRTAFISEVLTRLPVEWGRHRGAVSSHCPCCGIILCFDRSSQSLREVAKAVFTLISHVWKLDSRKLSEFPRASLLGSIRIEKEIQQILFSIQLFTQFCFILYVLPQLACVSRPSSNFNFIYRKYFQPCCLLHSTSKRRLSIILCCQSERLTYVLVGHFGHQVCTIYWWGAAGHAERELIGLHKHVVRLGQVKTYKKTA